MVDFHIDPKAPPSQLYFMNNNYADTNSYIILNYPNETTVTIEGDAMIIKQLVDHLDGLVIDFVTKTEGTND